MDMQQKQMEEALEKARREWQETLDRMTPEEREQALRKAQQLAEEDAAARQKLLDDARRILGDPAPKAAPKFCTNCGAPVSGGKFCTNCGSAL